MNAFDDTASAERMIAVDCFIFLIWGFVEKDMVVVVWVKRCLVIDCYCKSKLSMYLKSNVVLCCVVSLCCRLRSQRQSVCCVMSRIFNLTRENGASDARTSVVGGPDIP